MWKNWDPVNEVIDMPKTDNLIKVLVTY
jgi:hypothetical protein